MRSLTVHIILAFILAYFVIDFTAYDLTISNYVLVLIGIYMVLWLVSFIYDRNHFKKAPRFIHLLLYFIKEVIVANINVALEALKPQYSMQPAVIALPLDAKTDFEITSLANMISLTPGTLSIDVSEDRTELYVHTIYSSKGTEEVKRNIKEGFEQKLLKVTR